MSKRVVILIISLLFLSLIGLSIIQLHWINNSIDLENKLFKLNVQEALANVTKKIEVQDAINAISRHVQNSTQPEVLIQKVSQPAFRTKSSQKQNEVLQVLINQQNDPISESKSEIIDNLKKMMHLDSSMCLSITFPEPDGNSSFTLETRKEQVLMNVTKSDSAKTSQFHLKLSINDNLKENSFVQRVFVDSFQRMKKEYFKDTLPEATPVPVAVRNVARTDFFQMSNPNEQINKVNEKGNSAKIMFLSDIASKVTDEIACSNKTILERVPPSLLDSLIKTELHNKWIEIPYQYCIVSGNNDSIVYTHATSNDDFHKTSYKASLFPSDIVTTPHFLILSFPKSDSFDWKTIWMPVTASLAFILLIVGSFSFTVLSMLKQKKLSDMKSDFINNMTHEFKTPIATISLASEALKDPLVSKNSDRLSRFISIIFDENKRLACQVEKVLQAAQLDRGDFRLNLDKVNLHDIIQNAIDHIILQIDAKHGQISSAFHADNAFVHADEVHLTNIIFNLLDNANKYSNQTPNIYVSTRNCDKGIIVSVQDNGIGITRDEQKRIFEKFYRVPTGNLHDVKGFGLGLSYVKTMIEAHFGTISVQSEQHKGTRFDIFMPNLS